MGSGGTVFVPSSLGGADISNDGRVISAKALRVRFAVVAREGLTLHVPESVDAIEAAKEWELEFIDAMETSTPLAPDGVELAFRAERSLDDGVEASQSADFGLIGAAFAMIFIFASLANTSRDPIETRTLVSLSGVLATGMSIPAGFGLASACGMTFASIVGGAPFLLVGLGVDDLFILSSALQRTSPKLPVPERMAQCFRSAGLAITITSVTDILAFGIGASSAFQGVTIFAVYTALAVFFLYFFMCTFVAACMVLDLRRERAGRSAYTCHRHRLGGLARGTSDQGNDEDARPPVDAEIVSQNPLHSVVDSPPSAASGPPIASGKRELPSSAKGPLRGYVGAMWDRLFANKIAPFVVHPATIATTLVCYVALIGVCLYGATQLGQGLALVDLSPDSHHSSPFEDRVAQYYRTGFRYEVIVDGAMEYRFVAVRRAVSTLPVYVKNESSFIVSVEDTWLDSFEQFRVTHPSSPPEDMSREEFRELFADWLDGEGGFRFGVYLSLVDAETGEKLPPSNMTEAATLLRRGVDVHVRSCRMLVGTVPLSIGEDTKAVGESMTTTRDVLERGRRSLNRDFDVSIPAAFLWFDAFVFFEQFPMTVSMVIQALGYAALAMVIVAAVLFPSVTGVVTVFLSLVGIDILVLGTMWIFGIKLSSVSTINLVISVGFSVDFTAHIVHAFLHASGEGYYVGHSCCLPSNALPHTRQGLPQAQVAEWMDNASAGGGGVPLSETGVDGASCGPTRKARVIESLTQMGRPVFQGGFSTLLGLVPLAFTDSFIFHVFFTILFSTIVFGLLHGTVIIPVYLRIWGPETVHHDAGNSPSASDANRSVI